jgi:hypothetical protein
MCYMPRPSHPPWLHHSNYTWRRVQVMNLPLRSFIQRIRPGPMLLVIFWNKLIFYGEDLLAPRPTPKLEDQSLSAVRDCFFNIFAASLHTWRASRPSATWGRAMPWWQGTHPTRLCFIITQMFQTNIAEIGILLVKVSLHSVPSVIC